MQFRPPAKVGCSGVSVSAACSPVGPPLSQLTYTGPATRMFDVTTHLERDSQAPHSSVLVFAIEMDLEKDNMLLIYSLSRSLTVSTQNYTWFLASPDVQPV